MFLALESLGFGSYIAEVKDVLQECKTVALKRRKASSRLENLGIPEEELLRQQQELFAKVKLTKVALSVDRSNCESVIIFLFSRLAVHFYSIAIRINRPVGLTFSV